MFFFVYILLPNLLFGTPCYVLWPNSQIANICESTKPEIGTPSSTIYECNETSTIAIFSRYSTLNCTGIPIEIDNIILAAPCIKTECITYTQTEYIGNNCQSDRKQTTFNRAVPSSEECINGVKCQCDTNNNAIVSYYIDQHCNNQPLHSWTIGNENICQTEFGMSYELTNINNNPCSSNINSPTISPIEFTNKPTINPIEIDLSLLNKQKIDQLFDKIRIISNNIKYCDKCNENIDIVNDKIVNPQLRDDRDNTILRQHGNVAINENRKSYQNIQHQNQNNNNNMFDPLRNIISN